MVRRANVKGTIGMFLPIVFILFILMISPALFSSAEEAHPAAETDYPDEVAGINAMFLSGNYILIGLAAVMGVAIIFVGFSVWRVQG